MSDAVLCVTLLSHLRVIQRDPDVWFTFSHMSVLKRTESDTLALAFLQSRVARLRPLLSRSHDAPGELRDVVQVLVT